MSKIKKVSYSKLKTFGQFQNEKVGAEAVLCPGDDPDFELEQLQKWVDLKLEKISEKRCGIEKKEQDIMILTSKKQNLEYAVQDLESKMNKYIKFMNDHGINIPDEDLPF